MTNFAPHTATRILGATRHVEQMDRSRPARHRKKRIPNPSTTATLERMWFKRGSFIDPETGFDRIDITKLGHMDVTEFTHSNAGDIGWNAAAITVDNTTDPAEGQITIVKPGLYLCDLSVSAVFLPSSDEGGGDATADLSFNVQMEWKPAGTNEWLTNIGMSLDGPKELHYRTHTGNSADRFSSHMQHIVEFEDAGDIVGYRCLATTDTFIFNHGWYAVESSGSFTYMGVENDFTVNAAPAPADIDQTSLTVWLNETRA